MADMHPIQAKYADKNYGKLESEKHVKRAVKKILDEREIFWWMPSANGYGKAGVHDFCTLKAGTFVSIETKFGYNKPSPHQSGFAESIWAMDGIALCVNDATLWVLETYLDAFAESAAYASRQEKVPDELAALMMDCLNIMIDPFKQARPGSLEGVMPELKPAEKR